MKLICSGVVLTDDGTCHLWTLHGHMEYYKDWLSLEVKPIGFNAQTLISVNGRGRRCGRGFLIELPIVGRCHATVALESVIERVLAVITGLKRDIGNAFFGLLQQQLPGMGHSLLIDV